MRTGWTTIIPDPLTPLTTGGLSCARCPDTLSVGDRILIVQNEALERFRTVRVYCETCGREIQAAKTNLREPSE